MPLNHALFLCSSCTGLKNQYWRQLEITRDKGVPLPVSVVTAQNFDKFFSAVWPLTTFIFGALSTDHIRFSLDYALLISTIDYVHICVATPPPSLVYRVKMHSHKCDCWVYGSDTNLERLLEITGDYLVFLGQSYTLLQLLLPSTELREGISPRVIPVRDLGPTRVMAQFVQAAINKGRPLHVGGLEGVLPVPEILLRSLGYRWKDKRMVCVVYTEAVSV